MQYTEFTQQYWENSEDPDQMLQNAASDQGLHCLQFIQLFLYINMKCIKMKLVKN